MSFIILKSGSDFLRSLLSVGSLSLSGLLLLISSRSLLIASFFNAVDVLLLLVSLQPVLSAPLLVLGSLGLVLLPALLPLLLSERACSPPGPGRAAAPSCRS